MLGVDRRKDDLRFGVFEAIAILLMTLQGSQD